MLSIFFLIVGNSGFSAATNGYDFKIELSFNGKHISSPPFFVKENELKTVIQETDTEVVFIEVIASEGEIQNHKGILMKFTVGMIGKDGQRTTISKPQILANESEQAQINVGKSGGSENLALSVVAKRKSF